MKKLCLLLFLFFAHAGASWSGSGKIEDWGFYAHREINFLAVFALPIEMIPFFKDNIQYISKRAVDPDRRRYAQVSEAPKHYIDMEAYFEASVSIVPPLTEVFMEHISLRHGEDTVVMEREGNGLRLKWTDDSIYVSNNRLKTLYLYEILTQRNSKNPKLELSYLHTDSSAQDYEFVFEDSLSDKGISPYNLDVSCQRLTESFANHDYKRILRYATDIGHYISDLCVPLHTTKNYNGQLTDQLGIHAFWESRIPEMYAEGEFDAFVSEAAYIEDFDKYFRELALESHMLVDDVLEAERWAKSSLNDDQIMCFVDRLGTQVKTQCPIFVARFRERMDGMVEARWRKSIWLVASVWYSCWVKAGSPALESNTIPLTEERITTSKTVETDRIRVHDY